MNFLKRAITSYLSHSSRPSRKCLFLLRPLAQSSMYSTTYRLSNPQPRKPGTTQKPKESFTSPTSPPSSSSSLTWSQRVKKQAEALTDWPRPSEIPYQAKVANVVNFVGQITTPVKFQSAPDGKSLAGAVISQEFDQSFVIPVVFEGDLAHVVASHVKLHDCVYVVGRLSEDPLPFVLGECQGNFHLVVENINFVQGFENKPFRKNNVMSVSLSAGGSSTPPKRKFSEDDNDDNLYHSSGTPESEICEPKFSQASLKSAETQKNSDDPWTVLVKNPSQWRDYREQKVNGSVKAKYPDFKHKDSGTPLWLNSAPKWVLPELENGGNSKQGNVKDPEWVLPELENGGNSKQKNTKDAKGMDSWKSLVENPNKWWDNRAGKKNAKAPDFKHKETGEALWLNSSPSWVLSKLPALKEKKNFAAGE